MVSHGPGMNAELGGEICQRSPGPVAAHNRLDLGVA